MKSKMKYLSMFIIFFIFLGCSSLEFINKMDKPPEYDVLVYGIIENEKVNRMGLPRSDRNDMNKMAYIIGEKYKIVFNFPNRISTYMEYYYIKFYDDFKMTINGETYIIPKEKIEEKESKWNDGSTTVEYEYPTPIDITKTEDNEYILDMGEIEILDKDGKVIKAKEKIPPLLFKKLLTVSLQARRIYYYNWAEDYPGGIKAIRELEEYFKSTKKY
ncbi:hypothetical protein [Fusobacterium animalis]|uniref:hypothetical protein n=1 Tax=Fusobacterium animalis TaxID=76859 RepID=UPI0030CCD31A